MRFCPFCSAENADDVAVCASCGRRLPPLPPRRARQPGTGVQLPPRSTVPPSGPRVVPVPPGTQPGSPSPGSPSPGSPSPGEAASARGVRPQTIPPPSISLPSLAPTPLVPAMPGTVQLPTSAIVAGEPAGAGEPALPRTITPTTMIEASGPVTEPQPGFEATDLEPPPLAPPPTVTQPALVPPPITATGTQPAPPITATDVVPAPPPTVTQPSLAPAPPRPATTTNAPPPRPQASPPRPGSTTNAPPPRPQTATNPPPLAPPTRAGSPTNAPPPRPQTATQQPLASTTRVGSPTQQPLASSPDAPPLRAIPTTKPPPVGAPPPRPASITQAPPPRSHAATTPPPSPRAGSTTLAPPPGGAAQPGVMVTSAGFPPVAIGPAGLRPPADDNARSLAHALSPGPAAQRREPALAEPADPSDPANPGRRRADATALPAPAAPAAPANAGDYPRASAELMRDAGLPAGLAIDASYSRDDGVDPPPTRIHRPEALVDRPFAPPKVSPVPEIPEPGLVQSARYTLRFARARWQRRGAIKLLGTDIKKDTDALDQVLGALGGLARTAKVDGRVFLGENAALDAAEDRIAQLGHEHNDVDARKVEENAKFVDIERERNAKLGEAERMVDEAQKELAALETQRRGLRDKRKELERRQKAFLKAAEDHDKQTAGAQASDQHQELRRAADESRREAAAIEPERQDVDRRLAGIERPISEVAARLDAAKAELDAAKRSLADAREGHTHRLDELDAEQKRKAREIAQAEGEVARRLVTLGTLVNLNRIEDPRFSELYDRIDRLRGAITARTTEIEKLTAEREAYDRGTLVRGLSVLGGAVVIFIALIVILRAILR